MDSAEACEKSSRWLWKEKLCQYWCEKARKRECVTNCLDMTFAFKVALNPNTTNQPAFVWHMFSLLCKKCHLKFSFNPFPNNPWFLRVCSTSLLKTLWEKQKLLVTSNFSFSHSVFYPLVELYDIFIKLKIVICKLFRFGRA